LIVAWVAQTCLQLVLLPIIIVGQNIQAAASEKRAILTYEDAAAVLEEANQIQKHLDHQDKTLQELMDRLAKLETKALKK
jgi:prefoldin subunit 5